MYNFLKKFIHHIFSGIYLDKEVMLMKPYIHLPVRVNMLLMLFSSLSKYKLHHETI